MKQHNDARKIDKQLEYQSGQELDQPPADSREAWEKEQYACFYNVLFPLMKDEKLPYEKIAKRTNLKEHRIQEVLTFRLKPSSRTMQLFGHRQGYCYVCNNRLNSLTAKEPVCLKCLQAIESAYLEIETDMQLLEQPAEQEALNPIDIPLSLQAFEAIPLPNNSQQGPLEENHEANSELERLKAELEQYKKHFGALPGHHVSGETTTTITPDAPYSDVSTPMTTIPSTNEALPALSPSEPEKQIADSNDTEQLLKILELDDREVACEVLEINDLINAMHPANHTPLRHFGFQRSKSHHKA